jgi:hypothetical protein
VRNGNFVNGGFGGVGRIRVDAPELLLDGVKVDAVGFALSASPAVGYLGEDDPDADGLANERERQLGTNRFLADTDGDTIADGVEVAAGLNPLVADALDDPDGDGLTNAEEAGLGTDPQVADAAEDFDGDGLTNEVEQLLGTEIRTTDTDGDGLSDGTEDANRSGVTDPGETDPLVADTDGDGLLDGADALPLDPSNGPGRILDTTGAVEAVVLEGRQVFSSIVIAAGTTVRGAGKRPLELVSNGDFVVEGTIDVSGETGENARSDVNQGGRAGKSVSGGGVGGLGGAAFARGSSGEGPGQGGGGNGTSNSHANGGGGGGFGSPGETGRTIATAQSSGGASYGDIFLDAFTGGSGGGGGGGSGSQFIPAISSAGNGGGGAGGGGAVKLVSGGTLLIGSQGKVLANGGVGGSSSSGISLVGGSGGSGSGGAIWLVAARVDKRGLIQASGGVRNGNFVNGGFGGVGRIRVDAPELLLGGVAADQAAFAASTSPAVGFFGPR